MVAVNRNLTSRSATITLTTGSNPNLSLATPYSFTLVQSASTPSSSNITWKVKWNGFSDPDSWGAFNGTPSGSLIEYLLTNMDTMTMVYKASEGVSVNDTSGPGLEIRVKPGKTVRFYKYNSGNSWSMIGSLTVPSVSKNDTI